jgi:integrase
MSIERYMRKDGLVSLSIKFFFHGRCYRRGLGPVSLRDARLAERQARVEAANGTFDKPAPLPASPTFATFATRYLTWYRTDARPTSWLTYASRIDNHLQPYLGSLRLDQISTRVIDEYRTRRSGEGAAPRSINSELSILSAVLSKAVDWAELPVGSRGRINWVRTEARPVRVLSDTEVDRLLFSAIPRLRPLIQFALQTGLRRGELLSLTWEHIDWARREVVITAERAKSRRRRAVPLNRAAIAVLRELQGHPLRHGRLFGYKSLRNPMFSATTHAGLPGVGCHVLRRTWATRCLERGVNIRTLQRWLGHASLVTTEKYLGSTDPYEREAIERLGETPGQHSQSPSA